jgi:hypothetical protein
MSCKTVEGWRIGLGVENVREKETCWGREVDMQGSKWGHAGFEKGTCRGRGGVQGTGEMARVVLT